MKKLSLPLYFLSFFLLMASTAHAVPTVGSISGTIYYDTWAADGSPTIYVGVFDSAAMDNMVAGATITAEPFAFTISKLLDTVTDLPNGTTYYVTAYADIGGNNIPPAAPGGEDPWDISLNNPITVSGNNASAGELDFENCTGDGVIYGTVTYTGWSEVSDKSIHAVAFADSSMLTLVDDADIFYSGSDSAPYTIDCMLADDTPYYVTAYIDLNNSDDYDPATEAAGISSNNDVTAAPAGAGDAGGIVLAMASAYNWSTGAWGACSASCDGGTQTRTVVCFDQTPEVVEDINCDGGTEPPDTQACNTQACGGGTAPEITAIELSSPVAAGYYVAVPHADMAANGTVWVSPGQTSSAASTPPISLSAGSGPLTGVSTGWGGLLMAASEYDLYTTQLTDMGTNMPTNTNIQIFGSAQGPINEKYISMDAAVADGTELTVTVNLKGNVPHLVAIMGGSAPAIGYDAAANTGDGELTISTTTFATSTAAGEQLTSVFGFMIFSNVDPPFDSAPLRIFAQTNSWVGDIFPLLPGWTTDAAVTDAAGTMGQITAKCGTTIYGDPASGTRNINVFVPDDSLQAMFGLTNLDQEAIAPYVSSGGTYQEINVDGASTTVVPADNFGTTGHLASFVYNFASPVDAMVGISGAGALEGDLDSDDDVDLTDLVLALQVTVGLSPAGFTAGTGADANNDGAIGVAEVIYILQDLIGLRPLSLTSSAFTEGDPIPADPYTCGGFGGSDVSPQLSWSNIPVGTQSFVLIMDDPDAPGGTWDHWLVYDIPAATTSLPQGAGAPGGGSLPGGALHGVNSWPNSYYQGPCPPSGTHNYKFKLYALDTPTLELAGDANKAEVETAMDGHILEQDILTGTFPAQ